MPYWIGAGLALAVALLARAVGFDRDRAFYAAVLIVVASYYDLFAVMAGSMPALAMESVVMTGFLILAVLGFRFNSWLLVAGLIAHGLFDFVHGHLIPNPGVPAWWPAFCLGFDVVAGVFLAALLGSSRMRARPRPSP